MKKEELKRTLNRFLDEVYHSESDTYAWYNLSFNGKGYDVYADEYGRERIDYARNVDEDTACSVILSGYKDFCHVRYKAKYTYGFHRLDGTHYNPKASNETNILIKDNGRSIRLHKESEYLDLYRIVESYISDGELKIQTSFSSKDRVKIYRNGELIWHRTDENFNLGQDLSIHLPQVSSNYNNVYLGKKLSGIMVRPIIVDLNTGKEKVIGKEMKVVCAGGLMYSSNVAFYRDENRNYGYVCYDLEKGEELNCFSEVVKLLPSMYKFSVCPVPDCILILTLEPKNNLVLYNIRTQEIVQTATFPVEEDKYYGFVMVLDRDNNRVIIKSFCPTEPLGSDVQCYSVYFDDFLK